MIKYPRRLTHIKSDTSVLLYCLCGKTRVSFRVILYCFSVFTIYIDSFTTQCVCLLLIIKQIFRIPFNFEKYCCEMSPYCPKTLNTRIVSTVICTFAKIRYFNKKRNKKQNRLIKFYIFPLIVKTHQQAIFDDT
jgi:hypothetical protein